MINYITIESWIATKSIQANKPTKKQRLLAWLRLKPLPEPLYWFEAYITILMPHYLKTGDIIMTRNEEQYLAMARIDRNNVSKKEIYTISSIYPMRRSMPEIGKAIILCSCCSEMDPNLLPYGGQLI